jgi:hypothetical protein
MNVSSTEHTERLSDLCVRALLATEDTETYHRMVQRGIAATNT